MYKNQRDDRKKIGKVKNIHEVLSKTQIFLVNVWCVSFPIFTASNNKWNTHTEKREQFQLSLSINIVESKCETFWPGGSYNRVRLSLVSRLLSVASNAYSWSEAKPPIIIIANFLVMYRRAEHQINKPKKPPVRNAVFSCVHINLLRLATHFLWFLCRKSKFFRVEIHKYTHTQTFMETRRVSRKYSGKYLFLSSSS